MTGIPRVFILAFCLAGSLSCAFRGQLDPTGSAALKPNPYARIDAHALAAPPEAEASAGALARYLSEGAANDAEKARAIFRWITEKIRYDTEKSGHRYGSALSSRTAVCQGFSDLFTSLATAAGLRAESIEGWARGDGYSVGDPLPSSPNHAWNAVLIDGEWRLIDCTWGSGAMDDSGIYIQRFEPFYFFTPPDQLIYTHFPADEKWQLMPEPLTKEQFERLPFLKAHFFKNGLKLLEPSSSVMECSECRVVLDRPKGTRLMANLIRDGAKIEGGPTEVKTTDSTFVVTARPPSSGSYTLRLLVASPATETPTVRRYDWCADFLIRQPR